MKIAIDASVTGDGADPFLLVWTVETQGAASDGAALGRILREVCHLAAAGPMPEAEAAVERYRAELVKLGRNPNRYRISSDALLRRCRRDGAVPSILPLVDLNNILSLLTGWPVGCYDAGKIEGAVVYRLGAEGEAMPTLGKGDFDIARLPVLSDAGGPFGSTVSDSVRTAVSEGTEQALFVMYGYGEADAEALADLVLAQCRVAGATLVEAPALVRA